MEIETKEPALIPLQFPPKYFLKTYTKTTIIIET
jgi:hypothetical protein